MGLCCILGTLYLLPVMGTSVPLGLQLRETGRARERDLRNALLVDGREVHGENERHFISGG